MNMACPTRIVHLYSQEQAHDAAFIMGDLSGLIALRHAIDDALNQGSARVDLYTADGEGYPLIIIRQDSAFDWKTTMLPYPIHAPLAGTSPWEHPCVLALFRDGSPEK